MKTFSVRTFGCQMNKHDSERVAGLLDVLGHGACSAAEDPDLVVFMTCCVRENADERALGQVASLKALKTSRPGALIAVGGCIGQRDGESLLRRIPHVDIVFGTHNIGRLPELIARAEVSDTPVVEVLDSSDDFATDLPSQRESARGMRGCPSRSGATTTAPTASFPTSAARSAVARWRISSARPPGLLQDGVNEITLLGQNVNSYGRDLYGKPRFAEILERVAATGVVTRPIRDEPSQGPLATDTISVLAETEQVCPYLHLPVQSGSNRILEAMNRRYTREQYLQLVDAVYARDSRPRALDGCHRRFPRRDGSRLRGHARTRRTRPFRPGVHVHLLAP